MKSLITLASLVLAPTLLWADPAVRAPDFTASTPAQVDRSLAASNGTSMIEPGDLINFELDSTALDTASLSQLDTLARWMKAHPAHNVVLEGHTDRIGAHAYNTDLARRRAERARDHLLGWGISQDRIVLAIYGDRAAHMIENKNDRSVVMYASTRSAEQLAASALASTRADEVVWGVNGATLDEQRSR